MFGNPETTPGGLALKFYSSVRIDLRRIEVLKDGDTAIGSRHRARIVKNKVAPPLRVAEFDIMNEEGISKSGGLLDVAVDLALIDKKGSFFNLSEMIKNWRKSWRRKFVTQSPQVKKSPKKSARQ